MECMSRRKLKSDRELIADLTDRTKLFCEGYYDPDTWGCNGCPLVHSQFNDCRLAYIEYILGGYKEDE